MSEPTISIIMSYNNRPRQLRTTLESYEHHYGNIRDKLEIVIIDDSSNNPFELTDMIKDFSFNFKTKYLDRKSKYPRNPCVPYNIAAKMASGDYLNITNPENAHIEPIIDDALIRASEEKYIVYACISLVVLPRNYAQLKENVGVYVDTNPDTLWYQHSKYSNRLLHFCSIINRKR